MKLLGIILIAIGVVALIYQGITYTTNKEVVDIGPLEIQAKEKKTIPLPPIVGVIAIVAGAGALIVKKR